MSAYFKYHPYVYIFPQLSKQEFEDLKKDIAANGQILPIAVLAGTNFIIDGRHRHEACQKLGIETKIEYVSLSESQILWKVISLNTRRRHLSESQRAAIAAEIANLQLGSNQFQKAPQICGASATSTKEVAEHLNVGTRSVEAARSVKASFPEVWEHIKSGNITVTDAHKVKDEAPQIKQEVIARYERDKEAGRRTKKIAQYRKEIKQEIAKKALEQAVNDVIAIEVNEAPCISFGDVWQLGSHTLTCCDSATWDAPRAKLAFADPPYNAGMADWDIGFEWSHDWLIDKADIVVVTPGDESLAHFLRTTAMPYKCTIAHWIKNGMSKGAMGYGNHIIAAVFCNQSTPYKATGKRNQSYSESIIKAEEFDDTDHPGRKPIDFVATWIERLTNPGEVIIDAFLGSGTTLIAADRLNRVCHGAEINPEYCASILGRWIGLNKEMPKRINHIIDVEKKLQ